jgi:hypothetical protein
MPARNITLGGLIPVGFQRSTLSNSTAVAVNSTIRASAVVLDISVETNAARYRSDNTAPTLTTGVVLQKDVFHRLEGYNGTSNFRFQRSTGTSIVSIMGYKMNPGRA